MTYESERLQILEMIERGVISAAEGVRLLNALTGNLPEIPSSSAFPEAERRRLPARAAEPAARASLRRACAPASQSRHPTWAPAPANGAAGGGSRCGSAWASP